MFDMGRDIVYNGVRAENSLDRAFFTPIVRSQLNTEVARKVPQAMPLSEFSAPQVGVTAALCVNSDNGAETMSKTTQGITVLKQSIGEKLEDAQTKLELYASIDLDAPRWFIDLLNDLIYGHGLMIGDVDAHPMGAVGWAHEVMELAGRLEENVREVEK